MEGPFQKKKMANITLTCRECEKRFSTLYKYRKSKFCSRDCVNKHQTGTGNPMYGRAAWTKKDHPEIAKRLSLRHKKNGINCGDKNGMKQPEARAKLSATRIKMLSDPKMRADIAERTRKAWADGKFDGVSVGRCKWYTHIKPDGSIVKLQGTWELAFAKWLDDQNITYTTHKGRIPYKDGFGIVRSYYPDFWVEDWGTYVEIKNKYHMSLQEEKYSCIRASNPDLPLKMIFGDDLRSMNAL